MGKVLKLPRKTLSTADILKLKNVIRIPHFKGVMMRDELNSRPKHRECGIVNLNTSWESGSHWICYYKNGHKRFYFDSFAEPPPVELAKYLKTRHESDNDLPCIVRNSHTVQHDNAVECGGLCLYVLKRLSEGVSFPTIMVYLTRRYHKFPNSSLSVII